MPTAAEDTPKPVNCAVCNNDISESPTTHAEKSLECECCMKWIHTNCVKPRIDHSVLGVWKSPLTSESPPKLKSPLIFRSPKIPPNHLFFWKSLQMLQNEQKIYMYVLLLLRLCSMMKATSPDSDRLVIGKNGHGINRIIRMNIQNMYNRFITYVPD